MVVFVVHVLPVRNPDDIRSHPPVVAVIPARYASLTTRGLRQAADDDPRVLIVADEVQRGTRNREHGSQIKEALTLIAEQSAALGDVMILAAQREQHSVPPNVRISYCTRDNV